MKFLFSIIPEPNIFFKSGKNYKSHRGDRGDRYLHRIRCSDESACRENKTHPESLVLLGDGIVKQSYIVVDKIGTARCNVDFV